MVSGEAVHVAVVLTDSSTLEETVARGCPLTGGDQHRVTVLCPSRAVSNRVSLAADDRDWELTVEFVDPFTPDSISKVIETAGVDHVVVDPRLSFPPSALQNRLSIPVSEAPNSPEPPAPTRRLRRPTGLAQRVTLFALAFGFYLLLGRMSAFDIVTGVISATAVLFLLSHVTFANSPSIRRTLPRLGRSLLSVPYLLWEIVKANVALALVLLDPRLPIDPSIEELETNTHSDLERAVLANSISLTPGTLAVDVRDSSFVVHTITEASRTSLRERGLERAVGFIFRSQPDEPDGEGR